jgi:hypothetical protein
MNTLDPFCRPFGARVMFAWKHRAYALGYYLSPLRGF